MTVIKGSDLLLHTVRDGEDISVLTYLIKNGANIEATDET